MPLIPLTGPPWRLRLFHDAALAKSAMVDGSEFNRGPRSIDGLQSRIIIQDEVPLAHALISVPHTGSLVLSIETVKQNSVHTCAVDATFCFVYKCWDKHRAGLAGIASGVD